MALIIETSHYLKSWTSVDKIPDYMVLLGHNELTRWPLGDLDAILKSVIFNLVLLIGIFRSSRDNALRWMPLDLTNDQSTLVQVMAWCRQATSHYLSQCWPRSLPPYGVTRPQWVNEPLWSTWCSNRSFRLSVGQCTQKDPGQTCGQNLTDAFLQWNIRTLE